MLPKFVTVAALFLLMSASAFGKDATAFEFPPPATPIVPLVVFDLIPPAVVDSATSADADEADSEDQTPRDWLAFFQEYLIPLVALLMGLFGGSFGVRFQKRRALRKKLTEADKAETGRILSMLSNLVPQLHGKVVLGDAKARKLDVALAKAKEALDEAVGTNG